MEKTRLDVEARLELVTRTLDYINNAQAALSVEKELLTKLRDLYSMHKEDPIDAGRKELKLAPVHATGTVPEPQSIRGQCLAIIRAAGNAGTTISMVASATAFTYKQASNAIFHLVREGMVLRNGDIFFCIAYSKDDDNG